MADMMRALTPEIEALLDEAMEEAFQGGESDGLPVIPPSEARVAAMLGAVSLPAGEVLGTFPPRMHPVSVRDAARQAVMAGCLPAYFPVVVAAVRAVVDPAFNLLAIQATTEMASPLIIVNGPVARAIGMNAGANALGQGNRANATIGRALRLVLANLGGAVPGETDLATFGHPGKFTYCLAENEAESPWEPLHAERGFSPGASAVTVVGTDPPANVNDHASGSGEGILQMVAGTMAVTGSNNALGGGEILLVFSPAHAAILARDGFTKAAIRQWLHETARVPLVKFSAGIRRELARRRARYFAAGQAPEALPIADEPEEILIVVAGGIGNHTLVIPTYGETRAVTREIR